MEYYDFIECGDSLELMKYIPDKSIDLIVTDPPYELSGVSGGGIINTVMKLNESLNKLVEAKIDKGYDIETFGNEFLRIMKEPNIYIYGAIKSKSQNILIFM